MRMNAYNDWIFLTVNSILALCTGTHTQKRTANQPNKRSEKFTRITLECCHLHHCLRFISLLHVFDMCAVAHCTRKLNQFFHLARSFTMKFARNSMACTTYVTVRVFVMKSTPEQIWFFVGGFIRKMIEKNRIIDWKEKNADCIMCRQVIFFQSAQVHEQSRSWFI